MRSAASSVLVLFASKLPYHPSLKTVWLPHSHPGRNVHIYAAGTKRDDARLRSAWGNDVGITMFSLIS